MYVILVNNDNTMSTTVAQRIMQRSKLVDDFWFLASSNYNNHDMSQCTVLLEYLLPISRKYHTELLRLSEDRYEGYLKYLLPVDTKFTAEHGEVELQISFIYSDIDADGNSVQRVRKISPTKVKIHPISAWSDIIPDSALTSLDQRIIKLDAQIKALNDINTAIYEEKADNIAYNEATREVQLFSGEKPIGDKVVLSTCNYSEDGLPVVDLNNVSVEPDDGAGEDEGYRDVVIF